MKRVAIIIFSLLVCHFTLRAQTTATAPAGSGTLGDPYIISTLGELSYVAQNMGATNYWASGVYLSQTSTIDASATQYWDDADDNTDGDKYNDPNDGTATGSNEGFTPIGNSSTKFLGSYNGQGYAISGLTIVRSGADYVGFFGFVDSYTSVLTDIHLSGGSITGRYQTGSVAGSFFKGDMSDCSASTSITATSNGGGLAGQIASYAFLTRSYATGDVNGSGQLGGLVGLNQASGAGDGISRCYAIGDVIGSGNKVGGLVGYNTGRIENSYAGGAVTANDEAGGLVGHENFGASTITHSNATGSVSATGANEGGLIGSIGTAGTYTNNFWDTQTSGQATSSGATGKTTAEMVTLATFTDAGWDFMGESVNGTNNYWGICSWSNGGYPFLDWQGYENDCSHKPHGGYALDFDGTDDYVEIPHSASFNIGGGDFSFEAWIKTSASGAVTVWLDKDDTAGTGIEIFQTAADKVRFYVARSGVGNNDITSLTSIGSDWTHVAVTRSGNLLSIYMNGKLDNTSTSTAVNFNNSAVITLGANKASGPVINTHFGGKIDDVRFWSDARTKAEIQANMHKELAGDEANLAAYYSMYDSTGTSLTDNSGNGNTGTLTNGPVWKTSGAHAGPGMALDFDGTNDYIFAPLTAAATSTITVEGWFSFNSLTNQQNFMNIHQTGNVLIRFVPYKTATNEIALFVYDGAGTYVTTSSFTVSQTGVWHHLVFIYDAGTVSIYANGVLVGSNTGQGSFSTAATNQFSVGADYDGTTAGYLSNIKADEIRIWSTARTEAEIRANKDRALDGDEDNLLAYYRFDQQADAGNTILYDQTSNGHDGTLTSMTPASDWVASTPFNTWVGADDGVWTNAANWSLGAVPSTEDVGIFRWSGNNAPASANITGKNIYVDAGVSMSSTGNLTLSNDFYNAGTFTTTGNVTFSGSVAQTIRGTGTTTFGTFTVNNSKGVVLATDLGVTSDLALTSGVVNLGGQTLTLGSSASVSGSPADGNHVNATSGTFRKSYSGTGSFAFPVGDATLYSPITLNFTSGTFSSAYADVDLTIAKHPENISTGHYLSRYWTVSSSGISAFSCDVSATYVDGDITGTESELHGGKWDGSAWLDLGSATPASNLITGTVSGFSDFTGGQPYAFPVEWLNFSAKPAQDAVLLDWTTASEQNSDFFAIERSGNLEQWEELGTQAAAGNSTYQLDYQYEDQQPLSGTAWYRLRQVDLDGSFQYSATLAIHFAGAGIVVYPNPVKDKLTIEVPSGQQLSVELINLQGQQIWQQQLTDGVQQLSLSELPSGLYTLRMRTEQNGETSYQIVKQ